MKLGLKPRSRRVVQDSSTAVSKVKDKDLVGDDISSDDLTQCYWASLPIELLREVLVKLEESESKWPARQNVVACAGVCKSWREVMKEVVKVPEFSGRITFPVSVKQPGPRDSPLRCFIKRDRTNQMYHLYASLSTALADNGKFLLSARKVRRTTCTDYMISLSADDASKGHNNYVGKLRSNFLGTKFVVYDAVPPHYGAKMLKSRSTNLKQPSPKVHAGNYPVAHISYELNVLGASSNAYRGPRRMHCVMDAIPTSAVKPGGSAPTQTHFAICSGDSSPVIPFFRSKSNHFSDRSSSPGNNNNNSQDIGDGNNSLVLRNKSPRWHEQLQCWCLNFHGRVTVASVKNFQLVVSSPEESGPGPENERAVLQFGKVGKDVFTMDYSYPISAFQGFAMCLSSFDTKIACE